jgi:DNA-binding transcriptional LysR family regulator
MPSIRADVGPLATLFAFEAAGRLGSFTRAADELGVTQAAVSKQVAALEQRLGRKLFVRRARHIELTPAGGELFETTSAALASVARAMREIQALDHAPLTIALSIAMSQFWLMPILPEFTDRHPDIRLRILSQDDLSNLSGADIVISFQTDPGPDDIRLFGGEIVAMASPGFLRAHRIATAADLLTTPRIQYDTPNRSWISWAEWASHARLDPPRPSSHALSVSRYQDALLAAIRDQGAVLAWSFDGEIPFPNGELVLVPGPRIPAPGAFFLSVADPSRPGVREVVGWLRDRAGRKDARSRI